MPFAYYAKLNPAEKAVYRRSDAVPAVRLKAPARLRPLVDRLKLALASAAGDPTPVEAALGALAAGLVLALDVEPVNVRVLEVRPRWATAELHGLYEHEPGSAPQITVWMRTAQRRRVVAFRTFLRTFLHELCHHLDYTLLELPQSFHTDGFFQRESSLVRQLSPRDPST